MSTRSRIGIRRLDGSFLSIYCHWDGYLSYNGDLLYHHYTDTPTVMDLMYRGDISTLGKTPDACESYSDRGETDVECKIHACLEDLLDYFNNTWEEYLYIFDEFTQTWVWTNHNNFIKLTIEDIERDV